MIFFSFFLSPVFFFFHRWLGKHWLDR